MREMKIRASRALKTQLGKMPEGNFQATQLLDDGSPIAVKISIRSQEILFDFAGTGPVHGGNLNATPAIVRSAILYVLRLMVAEEIPLNEGLMSPVEVCLPDGLLNPAFPKKIEKCPAVVGGNVETSQRLVDPLIKAFGLYACSQGTMNNPIFGSEKVLYYETIGSGCGAGPSMKGFGSR